MKQEVLSVRDYLVSMLLFILGFSSYLILQLRYPLPYGVDGAFYAGETKCILLSGYPCLTDSPLPLYIPVLFTIAGLNIYLAVKLSLVLFTSITVIPVYFLSKKVAHNSVYAIIVSLVYLFNPFTMRLGVEFLKNLVALFFLAIIFYYFYKVFVEGKDSDYKYLYLLTLLTALSHILVYGMLVLFTIMALLYSTVYHRNVLRKLGYLVVFEFLLVVAGIYTPILGWAPYFKAVAGSGQQLATFKTINYVSLEALLAYTSILLLSYTALSVKARRSMTIPLLVLELLALLPLPMLAGISWRILLLYSLYLPLSLALSVGTRGNYHYALGITILLLAITSSITGSLNLYKPALEPSIISELEKVVPDYSNNNTVFIVPDKILRHWVFFIAVPRKVFSDYSEAIVSLKRERMRVENLVFIEILYTPNPEIKPPEPSLPHTLLYCGEYVYVYEIESVVSNG